MILLYAKAPKTKTKQTTDTVSVSHQAIMLIGHMPPAYSVKHAI